MFTSAKNDQVTATLIQMGFSAAFSERIGRELNTAFTANRMLQYLEAAHPDAMESAADEMLETLEWRERYIQRKILYD